jgi:hypothetical protein
MAFTGLVGTESLCLFSGQSFCFPGPSRGRFRICVLMGSWSAEHLVTITSDERPRMAGSLLPTDDLLLLLLLEMLLRMESILRLTWSPF